MKNVILVDDHESIRELLAAFLVRDLGYRCVGEAATGLEAVRVCASTPADLIVLDLLLPDINGVEVLRRIRKTCPDKRVLIFSGTRNAQLILAALRCRPQAFVEKGCPLSVLQEAVRAVANGGSYFSASPAAALLTARSVSENDTLTGREREIVQMVAQGWSSKEIADKLDLKLKRVENARGKIMRKLKIDGTARVVIYAIQAGLFSVE